MFASFKASINKTLQICLLAAPGSSFTLYDFCAVLRSAYSTAMPRSNIHASFRRAGLWPSDRQRIIGVPRPASNTPCAEILGVKEFEALFRKKRKEIRASMLGEDAQMHSFGFFDTTAGCVMASARTLTLIEASSTQKQQRREINSLSRLEKELGRCQTKAAAQRENNRMPLAAVRRRARMAGLGLAEFQSQSRSIE